MQHFEQIDEGKAKILIPKDKKISRKLPVFYNPEMKLNRDIAILLLNCFNKTNLRIADILAGTGVRSIRFLKELNKNKIKEIVINDINKNAFNIIKKNLSLNKLKLTEKIKVFDDDANFVLLNSEMFDYVDVDPFGSPNHFLDCSIKKLRNNGILAVTATDTAALCGTSPKACLRKYWAFPLNIESMKEIGIRILTRKIQLIGAQYDKALLPIFCHVTKHYFRIYFHSINGKTCIDEIIKAHKFFLFCSFCKSFCISNQNNLFCCSKQMLLAGPLYIGQLWDKSLVSLMQKEKSKNKELRNILEKINQELAFKGVGFYDIYNLCSLLKINLPKKKELIAALKTQNFLAFETHFSYKGIKSDIPLNRLKDVLKSLANT